MLEDAELHCERLPDGRLRRRTCQPAIVSIYGEIATDAAAARDAARADAADPRAGVRPRAQDQLDAYADRAEIVEVPGMHIVMWDAFDEVAGAVDRFLA